MNYVAAHWQVICELAFLVLVGIMLLANVMREIRQARIARDAAHPRWREEVEKRCEGMSNLESYALIFRLMTRLAIQTPQVILVLTWRAARIFRSHKHGGPSVR